MRAPLGTLIIRYRTRLAACQRPPAVASALVVAALMVVRPEHAAAQRAAGEIGVSLTIVSPVAARTVALTDLRIERKLMGTRLSGSTNGFADGRYVRARPCESPRTPCEGASEHRLDVGRAVEGAAPRDVRLRMELLVVAGT